MHSTQSHSKRGPADPTDTSNLTPKQNIDFVEEENIDFVEEDGVVIIEDNPDIACELHEALNYFGLDAHVAQNAETALRIVERHPISYAILDYRLPDMNGLEVAKNIRKISPQSKIVIITGDADFYQEATRANTGSIAVLKKPISPSSIARFIGNRILNKS